MQATPVRPFSGGTYDTAVDGGKATPVSIVENTLRDATTLTTRIQALVEKLVGPHPVSAGKPNEADMPGTVFGNLANHARDVQSDIATVSDVMQLILRLPYSDMLIFADSVAGCADKIAGGAEAYLEGEEEEAKLQETTDE